MPLFPSFRLPSRARQGTDSHLIFCQGNGKMWVRQDADGTLTFSGLDRRSGPTFDYEYAVTVQARHVPRVHRALKAMAEPLALPHPAGQSEEEVLVALWYRHGQDIVLMGETEWLDRLGVPYRLEIWP